VTRREGAYAQCGKGARLDRRASLVPAAAVIPTPVVYGFVAAVKGCVAVPVLVRDESTVLKAVWEHGPGGDRNRRRQLDLAARGENW